MGSAAPRPGNDTVAVWQAGTAFKMTAGSGHSFVMDGDARIAQSPMEVVAGALAGCIGADVISIMRKKRQAVTALEVRVHGHRQAEHPRVFTELQLTFLVTGRGVDPEAVRRSIELAEQKYCPVTAMLSRTARIRVGFEIREAETVTA